jgi:HlyD family type I secretion membrane fusion protein
MLIGCPGIDEWYKEVPRSARWPIIAGTIVLLIWGLGFGTWAALAPLEGAVVASGSFVATGQNKQVQHLEGGIIREILIKEGDLVEPNQLLLRLDETAVKSKLRRLVLRQFRLSAIEARLDAEIHSNASLQLPSVLGGDATDPEVESIIEGQRAELTARRSTLLSQEDVLRKEISGLQETVSGYEKQVNSTDKRLALFDEELKDKKSLFDRQLIRKTEILDLQRSEASLAGDLGELLGRIGDAKERMARADQQIAQLRAEAVQKAVEELRQTESDLDDVQEQIRAAKDVVERIEIRAPVRGIVVKLNRHTAGGVIGAGEVILELLPVDDNLVIEARVNPRDISHVKTGQDSLVRLTTLNQRMTPMIEGKVLYVSADAVPEQAAQNANELGGARHDSFVVRVRLDDKDTREKVGNFQPTPGMPADVYIKTGQRTFFNYMMRPVVDSFSRAFRER